MNTPNNKRKRESQARIAQAFIELMQTREVHEISVTEVCKLAGINRTTFYANYTDIFDLADKMLHALMEQVDGLYLEEVTKSYNSNDFGKLLRHIYENQLFYRTCFKLGIGRISISRYDTNYAEEQFQNKYIPYHMEFFRAGFNRIVEMWLDGGCKETPEEMEHIIKSEYCGRG